MFHNKTLYICSMKHLLLIIGVFVGALLLTSTDRVLEGEKLGLSVREAVMQKQSDASDIQHKIEAISNDLKDCSCLTPRRVFFSSNTLTNVRLTNSVERLIQWFRLKQVSAAYKISENISIYQNHYISSLFCSMGNHVFNLRKLIL